MNLARLREIASGLPTGQSLTQAELEEAIVLLEDTAILVEYWRQLYTVSVEQLFHLLSIGSKDLKEVIDCADDCANKMSVEFRLLSPEEKDKAINGVVTLPMCAVQVVPSEEVLQKPEQSGL